MKLDSLFPVLMFGALISVWALPASSYENEPTGFGGLEWGSSVPEDMTYLSEDPDTFEQIFTRSTDALRLGGVSVETIHYVFNYTMQFCRVEVTGTGQYDHIALYDYLIRMHGEEDETTWSDIEGRSIWEGSNTRIEVILNVTADPPAFKAVYIGTGVVESMLEGIDSIMDALEDLPNESDEEEEDPFGSLFD